MFYGQWKREKWLETKLEDRVVKLGTEGEIKVAWPISFERLETFKVFVQN